MELAITGVLGEIHSRGSKYIVCWYSQPPPLRKTMTDTNLSAEVLFPSEFHKAQLQEIRLNSNMKFNLLVSHPWPMR